MILAIRIPNCAYVTPNTITTFGRSVFPVHFSLMYSRYLYNIKEIIGFRVKQNYVMLTGEHLARTPSPLVMPDDFVAKLVCPENLIHHCFQIVAHRRIAVEVDGSVFGEQVAHERQPFIHEVEVRIGAFSPDIGVSDGFQCGLLFGDFVFVLADEQFHRKVCADVKGRISVDESDFPAEFLSEACHDDAVIAPDESVSEVILALVLLLKEFALSGGEGFASWLIDRFDELQW